jgi:hypothetical protein
VTTITVADYTGFPLTGTWYIMIDSEQLQVSAGGGSASWTVTRGKNGTVAATHLISAPVFQCATSLIPIEPAFFEPFVARYNPQLMRNSFESFYETQIVETRAELKGLKAPATFETLTNWLAYAVSGNVTATTSDSHAYTWLFDPTLTADDLASLGAEVGNDTAVYHLTSLLCDQFVLDIVRGTDSAQVTADFLGQQAIAMTAKTPAITRTGLNMLSPASTTTKLDTATIGTTVMNDISSVKVTIKNGFQQLFFLNNVLYPTGAVRPQRHLQVEMSKWFDDATELANAMASTGTGTERKLRLIVGGPAISGSVTPNSLTLDSYLYWDTFPFKVDKDTWHVTFTGRTVYDVSAGNSWQFTLVNSLATMP